MPRRDQTRKALQVFYRGKLSPSERPKQLKLPRAPIGIRLAEASDLPLVYNSWKRSYRTSKRTLHIASKDYYPGHQRIIERVLARATTLVACGPLEPDQLYGWLCFEAPQTIHYCFVKSTYRRMGIAGQLAKEAGIKADKPVTITHWHETCDTLRRHVELSYNPYLLE
jgi:hypothetical protein